MKTNKEMLSSILKTTQMGQIGIRCVENAAVTADMKRELAAHRREFDAIEIEAHAIAQQRGWRVRELNPAVRTMSELMTRAQLSGGNVDSKIAGMMIQGNTKGIIKGLKNAHQHVQKDERVTALNQRLMDFEESSILKMKRYL